MADYHPLIARAVAGLENNTGAARRGVYERARAALVAQLRSVTPALSESDIIRERLGLEEAIRKIEAEHARKGRLGAAQGKQAVSEAVSAAPQEAAGAAGPSTPALEAMLARIVEPEAAEGEPPDSVSEPSEDSQDTVAHEPTREARPAEAEAGAPAAELSLPPPVEGVAAAVPTGPETPAAPEPPRGESVEEDIPSGEIRTLLPRREAKPSLTDQGLKGYRDLSGMAGERLAARAPRPQASQDKARLARELDLLAEQFARAEATEPPTEPAQESKAEAPQQKPARGPRGSEPLPRALSREKKPPAEEPPPPPPKVRRSGSMLRYLAWSVVLALIAGLAAAGYHNRANLAAVYHSYRGSTSHVAHLPAQPPPKIEDRIGQSQPERTLASTQPGQAAPTTQPPPAVAQRVVLYEEDPKDPQGRRYVGSVVWRTETVSPGRGLAPELAVKGTIEVPERKMTMTFSMVRNTDPALPASHTVDIRFKLPANFSSGGVASVPGILMKQTEQARGVPLAGLAVKVMDNVFLIGLSAVETDVERNTQLLKERPWFDIPIVYTNGSRAILAMEKGTPGERVFNEAFTAWGKTGTAAR